jgi:hypothetical protein
LEGGIEYRADTALAALQRLFVQQGLPERLRFDRDPRLWGSWTRDSYPSPWVRVLRCNAVALCWLIYANRCKTTNKPWKLCLAKPSMTNAETQRLKFDF